MQIIEMMTFANVMNKRATMVIHREACSRGRRRVALGPMTKNKAARKRPRAAPGTAGAAALLSGREEIGRRQRTIAVKMCIWSRRD